MLAAQDENANGTRDERREADSRFSSLVEFVFALCAAWRHVRCDDTTLERMARILINPRGSHGDVDPYLALAHALRARGHDLVLAMPPFFRDVVAREGFAFS